MRINRAWITQKGAASDIAALIDQSIWERVEQQIPLVEIPPENRKEWIETLDRAIEAMCTLGVGLAQTMNTLKALKSETSDFPSNRGKCL
jgi:hypothetical protein